MLCKEGQLILLGDPAQLQCEIGTLSALTSGGHLIRIETSCPLNEATAVFMLKNLCYHDMYTHFLQLRNPGYTQYVLLG